MTHLIVESVLTLSLGWAVGAVVGLIGWARAIWKGEVF